MDLELKDIIKQIGLEYKIEKKLHEIITKLNNEFFIKLKYLRFMTSQKWENLGLPINLYNILIEKYNSDLGIEREN